MKDRFYAIIGAVLIGATIFNSVQGFNNANVIGKTQDAIANNATQSCIVQKRGLLAQPHLTAAMADILALLTPPAQRHLTPAQRAAYGRILLLRGELAAYVKIENKQPTSRNCVL